MKKLFVIVFIFFTACTPKLSELPEELDVSDKPDLTIENFRMLYKIDSKLKADAQAPLVYKFVRTKNIIEFPKGVKVKFYDNNVIESANLTADYAINYEKENFWRFSGNVIIKNPQGAYLKTQELYFYEKDRKLYSMKYVEVINPDGTSIRGKGGFEANLDFSEYKFKNVDGIIKSFQSLE